MPSMAAYKGAIVPRDGVTTGPRNINFLVRPGNDTIAVPVNWRSRA